MLRFYKVPSIILERLREVSTRVKLDREVGEHKKNREMKT